ncbi:MAG: sugar phosphate isomerase/epimerase [Anaerolineae bacterium]|nr:sugar phosphate isomerase/epimerase [Anaerolineae bacterium]
MFKNLSAGAIGIRGLDLAQTIDLAKQIGFGGIDFSIKEAAQLADEKGVAYVRRLFDGAGVKPGQWGLPVAWNKDDQWEKDLEQLPKLAALGKALGCTRTATWCVSGSNDLAYEENWAWHIARFRPIAEVLAEYDCRLGIEFLGPKTIRERFEHEFVYTLGGMMELAGAIGTGNVGLLLDAWHLFTSGDPLDVLDTITAKDVVTVHVNDAPEGLTLETYMDNDRRLPMETGVIDLPGFIKKLAAMGYDGPVTPEPFSKRINELAAEDTMAAGKLIADYMGKMWNAAGLT